MSAITQQQFLNNYKVLEILGQGNCATVRKVKCLKTNQLFALKIWKSDNFSQVSQVTNQIEIITKLNDQAIPKIHYYYFGQEDKQNKLPNKWPKFEIGVIMEMCDRTLDDQIEMINKDRKKSYSQQRLWAFMSEMARLFAKMQRENINHRDIKPGNIMIKEENGTVKYKIIDFGYSVKNSPYAAESITGTQAYASPKIRNKFENPQIIVPGGVTIKDDVYSLGKTILELLRAKNAPNEKLTPQFFKGSLMRYDSNVAFLLSKMLAYNEEERWDFIEIEKQIMKIEGLKSTTNIVIDEDDSNQGTVAYQWQSSQESQTYSEDMASSFKKLKQLTTIQTQTEPFESEQTTIFEKKSPKILLTTAETRFEENSPQQRPHQRPTPLKVVKRVSQYYKKLINAKVNTDTTVQNPVEENPSQQHTEKKTEKKPMMPKTYGAFLKLTGRRAGHTIQRENLKKVNVQDEKR